MALEMFLRLDGVTGGSRNYQHKGWADVFSWTWGLARGHAPNTAAGDATVCMNRIAIVKPIGMETPAIMRLFAENAVIPTGQISVVPVVGKREVAHKYVEIALGDVVIRSIETGGDTEDTVGRETVELLFGKIKYEFHHQVAAVQGGASASSGTYGFAWDIANGAEIPAT